VIVARVIRTFRDQGGGSIRPPTRYRTAARVNTRMEIRVRAGANVTTTASLRPAMSVAFCIPKMSRKACALAIEQPAAHQRELVGERQEPCEPRESHRQHLHREQRASEEPRHDLDRRRRRDGRPTPRRATDRQPPRQRPLLQPGRRPHRRGRGNPRRTRIRDRVEHQTGGPGGGSSVCCNRSNERVRIARVTGTGWASDSRSFKQSPRHMARGWRSVRATAVA
jgi:hypothetical protein